MYIYSCNIHSQLDMLAAWIRARIPGDPNRPPLKTAPPPPKIEIKILPQFQIPKLEFYQIESYTHPKEPSTEFTRLVEGFSTVRYRKHAAWVGHATLGSTSCMITCIDSSHH